MAGGALLSGGQWGVGCSGCSGCGWPAVLLLVVGSGGVAVAAVDGRRSSQSALVSGAFVSSDISPILNKLVEAPQKTEIPWFICRPPFIKKN